MPLTNQQLQDKLILLEKKLEYLQGNIEPNTGRFEGQLFYDKIDGLKYWDGHEYNLIGGSDSMSISGYILISAGQTGEISISTTKKANLIIVKGNISGPDIYGTCEGTGSENYARCTYNRLDTDGTKSFNYYSTLYYMKYSNSGTLENIKIDISSISNNNLILNISENSLSYSAYIYYFII